jgi:hypothetical protein
MIPSFRDTRTDKSLLNKLAKAFEWHLIKSTPNPAPVEAASAIVGTPWVTTHNLPPQSKTTLEYRFMRFKDGITAPDAESS